jgi:hypothetical protein
MGNECLAGRWAIQRLYDGVAIGYVVMKELELVRRMSSAGRVLGGASKG